MKRKISASAASNISSKEKTITLIKLVKGMDLCINEVTKAMPSLLPVHQGMKSFTTAQKKILSHSEKFDCEEIHFQLTREFITMLIQSKIDINHLYPNRILALFNQYLSKLFIYDWNSRLYDKPHTTMSMELLAQILGCTRNQLNYRQHRINQDFTYRWAALKSKCEALNHAQIDSSMFWRTTADV